MCTIWGGVLVTGRQDYPHILSTSTQTPGFLWIDVQLMPQQVDVVHRQRARAIGIDEAEDPFQAPLLPPSLGLLLYHPTDR